MSEKPYNIPCAEIHDPLDLNCCSCSFSHLSQDDLKEKIEVAGGISGPHFCIKTEQQQALNESKSNLKVPIFYTQAQLYSEEQKDPND